MTGPAANTTYSYAKANTLISDTKHQYEYDKNGNLIKKTETDDDGRTIVSMYSYDYENRLVKAVIQKGSETKTITFKYDPLGRRIEKKVAGSSSSTSDDDGDKTYTYVYDNEDIVVEYLTKSDDGRSKTTATRYVHGTGIDAPLAIEQKGDVYYYHADGLGSITTITDAKQKTVESYTYDSYGTFKRKGDKVKSRYMYTAREWDEELGLYYYRARYYDPKAGRFITRDPIGFAGGINVYNYVGGNPVNFMDPSGLHTVIFNGTMILVADDNGNPVAQYNASSGRPGYMSASLQSYPYKGPIPEGTYTFDPAEFSEGGFVRNLLGDWGTWRVPLKPDSTTNTYGRDGFFIHGGVKIGSAGCIDLGSKDVDFHELLKAHAGFVTVIVIYPK